MSGSIIEGMVIDMNEQRLTALSQLRAFLDGTSEVAFQPSGAGAGRYEHIQSVIRRFGYARLKRPDKGLVVRYLMRTTSYSRQQLTRLIGRAAAGARLRKRYRAPVKGFVARYTAADVALLAQTDMLHNTLSGPATLHVMARAHTVFGDARYARLAQISTSHIYNLRKRAGYVARRREWRGTRSVSNAIGLRRAPAPDGRPGFIRIDSVHQGDQDGAKGVYHINAVDCLSQWELIATCEKISEIHLLPVIEALLEGFPFRILGFHADNGSEYINHRVAQLLRKLSAEFTKSRPRHSNDNGLAETKNGAVIRKQFGYSHIPQHHARAVNAFCREYLNPYVNFHRPCLFAEETVDAKGKVRKRYPRHLVQTPFEKLLGIADVATFLKPGITLTALQETAAQHTDNESATRLNEARQRLFHSINNKRPTHAA